MLNRPENEANEENREIGEYEEYLEQNSKGINPSTKSRDSHNIILDDCKQIKKDEEDYISKSDEVTMIKVKDHTHLISVKKINKVELVNLNCKKNFFVANEGQNKENLIIHHKKVSENNFGEKLENEKNKNIIRKEKQKKENKKSNCRKKHKKKIFSKSKKEENNEILSEIIYEMIRNYEHQIINNNNSHIPIQPFEIIKNISHNKVDNDEVLTEEAITNLRNLSSNRPHIYNLEQQPIMNENDGENLFNLNENNHSVVGWVDYYLQTEENLQIFIKIHK